MEPHHNDAAVDTRFLQALEAFLMPGASSAAEKEHLLAYLTRPPAREPVHDAAQSVDDMEQRVQFAKTIQACPQLLGRKLTVVEISALLALPPAALQAMQGDNPEITPNRFFLAFQLLLSSFVQVPLRDIRNNAKVSRNKQQAEMCRERDGYRCIFLHTDSPEVCHIFPFSANATDVNMRRLSFSKDALRCIVGDEGTSLLTKSLGCSDKTWNMITLNPQLHRWWSQGRFALKCLGVLPVVAETGCHAEAADVTIQLHWILKKRAQGETATAAAATSPTSLWTEAAARQLGAAHDRVAGYVCLEEGEAEALWTDWCDRVRAGSAAECLQNVVGWQPGCVAAAIPETGRLLLTGSTAKIRMPLPDAYRMKTMIDLQWSLTKVATMSGAAEFAELLRHFGKYEDDFFDSDAEECFEQGMDDYGFFDLSGF